MIASATVRDLARQTAEKIARFVAISQVPPVKLQGVAEECIEAALLQVAALQHAADAPYLQEIEKELAEIKASRQRIHDRFRNVTRDADGKCQCPYCTNDGEALAELAADYELEMVYAKQRAEKAEAELAALRAGSPPPQTEEKR